MVPSPACANAGQVYAANLTENPRSWAQTSIFANSELSRSPSQGSNKGVGVSVDRATIRKVFLGNLS